MKKLTYLLIGRGKMGSRWAKVLYKNGFVDEDFIVGKLTKDRYDTDELELLIGLLKSRTDIDAVVIATPHKHLAFITEVCLKAGKHVLCEKPGAITAEEIKNNIDLAKKMGLTYMIGYNCRFHDGFIKARKLYEKGSIGELMFIRARFGFGGREGYDKEWRLNKEISGGGHLHDQGVHMIDMAKSFLGKIKEVQGMTSDMYWKTGTEDNGFVLLRGETNAIASIHSSVTQWKRMHSFEIYGTKGYLTVEGLGKRYGEPEKLILGKRTKDPDVVKERVIKCNADADRSLELELKEFVTAIQEKRQPIPSPLDAYETLKIVEQVYEN